MFENIKKRDGRVVEFDSSKITDAIARAGKATGEFGEREARKLTLRVLTLAHEMRFSPTPEVEEIQDVVERVLLDSPYYATAKAYIIYREQHAQIRNLAAKANVDLVEQYIRKLDWKIKENSNMCYSLQGLNNYISSDVTSEYWLNRIYPPEIRNAHKNGEIHLHDLSQLSVYCVGWDLKDLLVQGFKGVEGKVESAPPKHLRSALGQVINFFYTLQGESAGAQALSNFDTLLAPFIRRDELDYREVKQAIQEFVFNINIPTRVGFQCISEDTEILTPEGWKGYEDIEVGDIIKTFNIKTGCIEDQPVRKTFAKPYKGHMYRLKNRIQDQLISPKHRVVRKKFNTDCEFILEEIEKIMEYKSPVIIPITGKNINSVKKISDDEIRLMAWIIAEGSKESYIKHRHCHRISIYQSKTQNPENYKQIIDILDRLKLEYTQRDSIPALGNPTCMIRLNAKSSQKILDDLFKTKDSVKFIPDILKNMDKRQARLFLDTYLKADGHEGCKITTTDMDILSGLQQIAVDAEYGFTVSTRKPTIGKKLLYILRLIDHQDTYIQQIEKVDYSGIIWCPTTDNETVIARRNGKVFITGNTPFTNITMDLYVPSILKDHPVIIGGKYQEETYAQFQPEMDMLNRAFAEIMMEGDARGRVFTFPIPTYNITKNFDWDNPNFEMIWKMTGRYGIPYYCLEADTPVLKNDHTIIPISSLQKGDKIVDEQGRDTQVTAVSAQEVDQTIHMELETGEHIVATPTHRFPTPQGLKTAQELSLNDQLIRASFPSITLELSQAEIGIGECQQWFKLFMLDSDLKIEEVEPLQVRKGEVIHIQPLPILNENPVIEFSYTPNCYDTNSHQIRVPQTVTPELCRLLGYLVRDRYYAKQNHTISFVNAEESLLSDFTKCLDTLFGVKYTIERAGHSNIAKQISVNSVMLRNFLKKIGLNRVTSYKKEVPYIIYKCSGTGVAHFLRALFDTDGTIDTDAKVISFCSTSCKLIKQVQILLLRLGILSYRSTMKKNNILTITGNNIRHFSEKVGFTSKEKNLRLMDREDSVRNSLGDPLLEYDSQLKILLERNQLPEHYRYAFKKPKYKNRFYRIPSEALAEITGSNPIRTDVVSDCKDKTRAELVEILKLTRISGKCHVIDISVDTPSHQFVLGSGIISHNSNFVNSDMSPEDARSMCCRLRLDNRELLKRGGGLFGANPLTGSIGVVTVNLPRIGYLSQNEKDFFNRLKDMTYLAKESLIIKRKVLENFTENDLYPYSKFYLRDVKRGTECYWKNHFSTVGIIGMNETCLNFMGHDIASPEGLNFSLRVMDFIRELLSKIQEETGDIFNLEATPAEGTSYRLAMIDKEKFPDIICANEDNYQKGESPYYTNSTQLPVNYTDDIFETLALQDELQSKYTGGTVLHIYLGEQISDTSVVKNLIRKIAGSFRLPYFTLTPTFSVCPSHGYLNGEQERCPICNKETEIYSRVVGYLRPVKQWNDGKQSEYKNRKVFKVA